MKKLMKHRVNLKVGKTMLVDGPATVQVINGVVNVMGAVFAEGSAVKIRRFRRTPFYAEQSEAELAVDGEKYRVVEGSTIPSSWTQCAERTMGDEAPLIAVVGESDSGKTSLAVFLVNYYLNFHGEVGVVDGDPGQNDLGIPGTVSAGVVNKGLSDLSQVKPEIIEFIGLTAPETGVEDLNEAIAKTVRKLREKGLSKTVLNTDGWVDSKGLRHKAELMRMVKPSFIVSLLEGEQSSIFARELDPSIKMIHVEKSPYVKRRSRIHRRLLRTQNYMKHFSRPRTVKTTLQEVSFLNHPFLNGEPVTVSKELDDRKLSILEAKQYMGVTYVRVREELDEPVTVNVNGKRFLVLGENWEKGLLVGLGRENKITGVGILESLTGNEVTVKTALTTKFDLIKLGEIKLDPGFNEKSFHWKPRE
ncbi:MAG: Clp1/GlmU family protein [Thermoproteota archaeon]